MDFEKLTKLFVTGKDKLNFDDAKCTIQGVKIPAKDYPSVKLAFNINTSETGLVPNAQGVKYIYQKANENQDKIFKELAKEGFESIDPKIDAKYRKYYPKNS